MTHEATQFVNDNLVYGPLFTFCMKYTFNYLYTCVQIWKTTIFLREVLCILVLKAEKIVLSYHF